MHNNLQAVFGSTLVRQYLCGFSGLIIIMTQLEELRQCLDFVGYNTVLKLFIHDITIQFPVALYILIIVDACRGARVFVDFVIQSRGIQGLHSRSTDLL